MGLEVGAVKTAVNDMALSHPEVGFRLSVDGKQVGNYAPVESFFERAKMLKIAGSKSEGIFYCRFGKDCRWSCLSATGLFYLIQLYL